MKNIKKIATLLFAIVFCLSAGVMVSAEEVNTVDGSILEFAPLQGDVNIDGYLNLKDLVRYKKYIVSYDEFSVIDEEVADFNDDGSYNASDLVGLQEAIVNKLFG